ncbi:hypothetical protein PTI98_008413 [Pleurotus ostreatus]|nr:hypothetical protein PTI98_008413 [Pleurotus ostreatus]
MSFENTLSSRQPASVPLPCTRMPTKLLPPSSDVDILEPLGLPLRGFQTNDATPTTAPTSLPTPSSKRLQHVHVFPDQQWLLPSDAEHVVEAPGAPLMRDYDSFTEGTAKGSFDSIPIEATDQYGEQLLVLDHETVGTLPIDIGARSTIERWRDVVSQSMDDPPAQHHMPPSAVIGFDDEDFLVTPTKRPHSITSEDAYVRAPFHPVLSHQHEASAYVDVHGHIQCHPIIEYHHRKTSAIFPLSIEAPIGIRGYLILSPDEDVPSGDDNQNCILVFVSVLIKALDNVSSFYVYMWTTLASTPTLFAE